MRSSNIRPLAGHSFVNLFLAARKYAPAVDLIAANWDESHSGIRLRVVYGPMRLRIDGLLRLLAELQRLNILHKLG
jgi:hypothetical protein